MATNYNYVDIVNAVNAQTNMHLYTLFSII